MAAVGLSHYNIKASVPRLKQVRDFYCQMVGLVDGPRPPFKFFGYWLYAGPNAVLHLSEAPAGDGEETRAPAFIDHVAFTCVGFEEMKERLDAGGIAYRAATVPERNLVQLFLKDTLGNGVELIFTSEPS